MKELKSTTDIKKLIEALPEAKFLEDYSRLVEEYEESPGDTPFNVDTIGLTARMVQLFFTPKRGKLLALNIPKNSGNSIRRFVR